MPNFTARTGAVAGRKSARKAKSRRPPFPLIYARKCAQLASELGCDLLINPTSGEFLIKTSGGTVVFDRVIDGRSISANYPRRVRKPDPALAAVAE